MPIERDLSLIPLQDAIKEIKQAVTDLAFRCGQMQAEAIKRVDQIEKYIYSEGDISALIGQVDNVNKNSERLHHWLERLEKLVNSHEDYLKSIDKIALHDPVKTLENMKMLDKRIETIETIELQLIRNQFVAAFNRIEKLEEDIAKLEDSVASRESVADAFTQLRDNTNERLRILEQMHTENVYKPIESGKKPYKCPVCEGKINLPMYTSISTTGATLSISGCHVCKGEGIVWG